MTQSEELWEAAAAVGAASRPLPLFYCLSQAGRAICAAWLRHDWRPTTHGISSRIEDQSEEVPTYAVRASRNGMYPRVAEATDSRTFDGPATVAELWASLPDLPHPQGFQTDAPRPIYLDAVDVDPPSGDQMELLRRPISPEHARFSFIQPTPIRELLLGIAADEERVGEVAAALEAYPTTNGVVAEVRTAHGLFGEERTAVLTFPDESGALRPLSDVGDREPVRTGVTPGAPTRFMVRPRIGSGQGDPPSQLMTLWALLYAFSQLARYEPEVWVGALNPNESAIAVDLEHALDTALELAPELLVPAVTNGLMPRLIRERMENDRRDQEREAGDAPEGDGPMPGADHGANRAAPQ